MDGGVRAKGLFLIAVSVVCCVSGWCDWARRAEPMAWWIRLWKLVGRWVAHTRSPLQLDLELTMPIIHRVSAIAHVSRTSLLTEAQTQTFVSSFSIYAQVFAGILLCGSPATSVDCVVWTDSMPEQANGKESIIDTRCNLADPLHRPPRSLSSMPLVSVDGESWCFFLSLSHSFFPPRNVIPALLQTKWGVVSPLLLGNQRFRGNVRELNHKVSEDYQGLPSSRKRSFQG